MKDLNASSSTWADTLPSQWGPELAHIESLLTISQGDTWETVNRL